MDKNTKILIIVTVILGLIFSVFLYLYLNKKQVSEKQIKTESLPETLKIREQVKDQTKIKIGTQGVTKGIFEKVENGNIFVNSNGVLTQLSLTQEEIAVSCTAQDLSAATQLDFDQVTKVNVATPATLSTFVPAQETVVLFSQNVEGINRVHTVALDNSKCLP